VTFALVRPDEDQHDDDGEHRGEKCPEVAARG
jgi:hypothetical protein